MIFVLKLSNAAVILITPPIRIFAFEMEVYLYYRFYEISERWVIASTEHNGAWRDLIPYNKFYIIMEFRFPRNLLLRNIRPLRILLPIGAVKFIRRARPYFLQGGPSVDCKLLVSTFSALKFNRDIGGVVNV